MGTTSRVRLCAALVAATIAITGCGGDDDASADGGEAVPPPESTSTTDAPTTTSTTTTVADAFDLEWSFHVVTTEGWEYDVDVSATKFNGQFSKDVSTSPPGRAQIISKFDAPYEVTVTPTLAGRTTPSSEGMNLLAMFAASESDQRPKLDGTGCFWDSESVPAPWTLGCQVVGSGTGRSGETDEARADWFVGEMAGLQPVFYSLRLKGAETGRCGTVALHPDGGVSGFHSSDYDQNCTVTAR